MKTKAIIFMTVIIISLSLSFTTFKIEKQNKAIITHESLNHPIGGFLMEDKL